MSTSSPGALDARTEAQRISRPALASRVVEALGSGSVLLTAGAGFAKTTSLEQALSETDASVAWIGCTDAERSAGTLLVRLVDAIAVAVPGASDALAERLAAGPERVDVVVTTRELLAELSKLLVEPLVVVFDDAEHLAGAEGAERLVSELIRSTTRQLHVAVASRKPLDLRVAKPRAAGTLGELTAGDLAFDTEETVALLRAQMGREPAAAEVEQVLEATEGWPLGVAMATSVMGRGGGASGALSGLSSAPGLRAYLSEELLDSLDRELFDAALASSVPGVVDPGVQEALDLPRDLCGRLELAGVPLRRLDRGGAFAYHPLVREFLLERLREVSSEESVRKLHAEVAPAVLARGDAIAAVEHLLAAEQWEELVAAIEAEGPSLLRASPELMTGWFEQFPAEVRRLPEIVMLEAQIEWGEGRHESAAGPLKEAVAAHRAAGDPEREWLARFFLAEALFSGGRMDEIQDLAEGWDAPEAPDNAGPSGVAWYSVLALTALGSHEEAELLASRLREEGRRSEQFRYLDDLAALMRVLAAGGAEQALVGLGENVRQLEISDPQGRLAVSLSVTGLVNLDIGRREEAMAWFERCRREAYRVGLGFVARDAHLQCASLLAVRDEVTEAEAELERAGEQQETGWRGVSRPVAEAHVASARGDAAEAVAAAERALDRVRPGLVCYRVWAALDMAVILARHGAAGRAAEAIDEAMEILDEAFPGRLGRYHRSRLLATRAWLAGQEGDREGSYAAVREAWAEAGDQASNVARAHWAQLEPVLAGAMADKAVDPADVLPAVADALPGAEGLVAFIDHPDPLVRGPALSAALAAGHSAVLSDLPRLLDDPDERVASAATAARDRLRDSPPALRYELLGRFRVLRAGQGIAESAWARPIDSRVVRFLLVHAGEMVPEDLVFEALWPELTADGARRSLQVAVSRARKVLDLPGAGRSRIESGERAYTLVIGERDSIDAREFMRAADAALAEHGPGRRGLLEGTRARWHGEPLPEERYADWAVAYRERLVDRRIAVLTALIEINEQEGDHAGTVEAARELVDLDPVNEGGQRALMTAYARSGRRGHALRQYLECRSVLVEQLGIEPEEATSRLQARILAGEVA